MLEKASVASFSERASLYRQGDTARRLWLVETGLIRLSNVTPEGDDVLVRFAKPGEVFGYFAIALDGPNPIAAQAVHASRLVVWDSQTALRLMQAFPQAAVNLFSLVARDANYFNERALRLQTQEVGRRVAWALFELARAIGEPAHGGILISHGVAQRELAELAGTTIFTVSRELSKLEKEGILEKQRGRILVTKPDKLAAL